MNNRLEVEILTQSPDEGNLTPTRQGRRLEITSPPDLVNSGKPERTKRPPARGRLVEVIGVWPSRTQVKRRKASRMGKPAPSGKTQYSSAIRGVVATGWSRSLLFLPKAVCRVPRKR
jgi:hypothetical protein